MAVPYHHVYAATQARRSEVPIPPYKTSRYIGSELRYQFKPSFTFKFALRLFPARTTVRQSILDLSCDSTASNITDCRPSGCSSSPKIGDARTRSLSTSTKAPKAKPESCTQKWSRLMRQQRKVRLEAEAKAAAKAAKADAKMLKRQNVSLVRRYCIPRN